MSRDRPGIALNISAVERDTGLSKDVLRMWERRYGFPTPARDDNGERLYSSADVGKLRAMKKLMDVGVRPGKIIGLSTAELNAMADARAPARRDEAAPALERDVLAMLKGHDVTGLASVLTGLLMRQGMTRFVLETITPLNRTVGEAWMRGELQVFEEHLYTEQLHVVLRAAINAFPKPAGTPRMLLTTFPSEQHGLGLLMVEAVMAPEGVCCISLGPQTPIEDIRRASIAHKAHIVALSFSAAFPLRQATDGLAVLRRELPAQVTLWAGGEMTRRVRKTLPGVVLIPDLESAVSALRSWRTHRVSA
ncbi:MAG: MerR family transcriptional regulator [Burkholderiales bacterium]|nr:MerR family transcriptional regulator [Burkholderiales bacterium]